MESRRWNQVWAVLTLLASIWGCTAHTSAPEVESVGQLSQGPSVYSAPVHATTDIVDTFEQSRPRKTANKPSQDDAAAVADAATPDTTEKASHGF